MEGTSIVHYSPLCGIFRTCTIYVTGPCEVVLDGMVIIIFSVFVDDGKGINPMAHKLVFYIHPYFFVTFSLRARHAN